MQQGHDDAGAGRGREALAELELDPDWRRDLSLLALRKGTPVGFVNVLGRWVDQVGVVPEGMALSYDGLSVTLPGASS